MSQPKLLFCVNAGWFFLSHRLPIARAAAAQGYEIHVACGIEGPSEAAEIEAEGFVCHRLPAMRGRAGLLLDIASFAKLFKLIARLRPAIVHSVTAKPIIMAGISARLLKIQGRVAALTGLGYLFTDAGRHRLLTRVVAFVMGLGIRGQRSRLILQNDDDAKLLVRLRTVDIDQISIIPGSGVDFGKFSALSTPDWPPLVILPARMLYDKGVLEFCEAAKLVRRENCPCRFALVGGADPRNPSAIEDSELARLCVESGVENWGLRTDMAHVFARSTVVCLPSYREGLPKVLIEAAAARRVIVTTDVPGCRDIVDRGDSGFMVPPRNAAALAIAIRTAIEDEPQRLQLIDKAYKRAKSLYEERSIVGQTLKIYGDIIAFQSNHKIDID